MSKKRKKKETVITLLKVVSTENMFCGFPLIKKNINQLFRWDNLEEVKFGN